MATNITLFTLFIIVLFLMAHRKKTKKRIVFLGDSITEQGKSLTGFISIINRQIEVDDLVKKYQTIASGVSGNRVYDLCFRLDEDVLAKSPNITVILIGINDVWGKQKNGTGLDIDKYERFYRAIIVKLLAANSQIVLCTLPVIGEKQNNQNLQDQDLEDYSTVVRKLAKEYSLKLCDLREAFVNYINQNNYENIEQGLLTTDGVHLNEEGNKLIATRVWEAIKTVGI